MESVLVAAPLQSSYSPRATLASLTLFRSSIKQVKPQASMRAPVRQARLWRNELGGISSVLEVALVDVNLLHRKHDAHRVGAAIEGSGNEGGVTA